MINNAPIRDPAGSIWPASWTNWFTQLVKFVNTLAVNLDGRAIDTAVVHKAGVESIDGVKTFTSSPIIPTPLTADSSTKAATTAFVKAQGYGFGTITGVTTKRTATVGTDHGLGAVVTYELETTGTLIRLVETTTYL